MTKRRLASLAMLFTALVAVCAHAQQGSAGVRVGNPVEGFQSADIGGRSLRYMCKGQGAPTVIVEQGGGISIETVFSWEKAVGWAAIVPVIAKTTRMCVYDRADLGLSSRTERTRTVRDAARDLHALLAQIRERPPYVIAGQSLGGMNARMYAHEYPNEVAGLILIDTQHHDWYARLAETLPPQRADESELLRGYRYGPNASALGERIDVRASLELLQEFGGIGDKPLVVLTRSPNVRGDGLIPAEWEKLSEPLHQRLQIELAKLSTNSEHIVAEKAGHNVQLEEPQLVIDAILGVVQQARATKSH